MLTAKPQYLSAPWDKEALILENRKLCTVLGGLAIVNKELAFQIAEKAGLAEALEIANKDLAFHAAEKTKRAAELVIANKELAFQNAEKAKRAAELVIANKQLAIQEAEKEIRAAELVIANQQLHDALMNTVRVAMILSELRDPYTAGHERRVAEISVAIGAQLGFNKHQQDGIRVAGYLHDVGKMIVPSEILSKPGKLTQVEYALIQQHARAGYDVLKGVNFPWPVAEVAWQHHERLDGTGYPRGLRGEDIILEARILSVADTVEAMSSHRPYRPALGLDRALAEIERGRGMTYDNRVAGVCLKLFREGFKITE